MMNTNAGTNKRTTKRKTVPATLLTLLTLLLTMALTACGGSANNAGNADPAAEQTTPAASPSQTEAPAEVRTVKHFVGETTITGQPGNIAALNPWITDFMLALGVKPGSSVTSGPESDSFSWYLKDQMDGVANLGWQSETDFEAILSAAPDLIIANNAMSKGYEQLGKIAPTVVLEPEENADGAKDWRATFKTLAGVLQKDEDAEKVIEAYDAKVQQAKEQIHAAIGDETVMFLRVTQKELRYYGAKNYDILYGDLGLKTPPLFPDNVKTFQSLSMEKLPEVNPDRILLLSESPEKLEELQESAIWSGLKAVQNNHVYPVDYDLWFQGFGPTAYSLIIDEAVEILTAKP